MSSSDEREIRVVLLIESAHLSSVAIASSVEMSPDESWERGAAFTTGKLEGHRNTSRWAVVERAHENEDCIALVDRLLTRVEPLASLFGALPADTSIYLRILVDDSNGVFGLGLEKRHVSFLASINAGIDISIAVNT